MSDSPPRPAQEVPLVDLYAHHRPLGERISQAIAEVIVESSFVGGRHVRAFEEAFAEALGVKHCIGVGNGTDALFIALHSLGVRAGDEVITVANSFIATSEAITRTGARVVFVDCDAYTYNIDVTRIEAAITPRTKAILPVHLYGQPAEMDAIRDVAQRHNLCIVEDAAEAHGASYRGEAAGTLGNCGCFSFYPGKNLGAMGDAGAITTDDDLLAQRVRMFANHGRTDKYNHTLEGVNSRLDALQAAVLSVKLGSLAKWNSRRREIAAQYDSAFRSLCVTPAEADGVEHVYHLYVVRVRSRERIRQALSKRGIATGIHYPTPLPLLDAYAYLNHRPEDFPAASALADEILSLPIHGEMTPEQVQLVIQEFTCAVGDLESPEHQQVQRSAIRDDGLRRQSA